jgi:hypothetical protein
MSLSGALLPGTAGVSPAVNRQTRDALLAGETPAVPGKSIRKLDTTRGVHSLDSPGEGRVGFVASREANLFW